MTEQAAENLGTRLRSAREQSGLTLRQVADATKLSVRTLDALEKNHVDALPGGVYRRGIVRAYAAEVGLDPEQTLRAFLTVHPDDVPRVADLRVESPKVAPSRLLQALFSVFGAVLPIAAGVVYFSAHAGGAQPPAGLPQPLSGRGAPRHLEASFAAATPADPVAMMISVSSETRLQVVADGLEVVAGPMEAGRVIRLDLANDVVLMGDDAGAVHFSINGRAGRTLGTQGAPLTAHILRDDYQAWLIRP